MILDIRHKTLHLREKTQESRNKTQDLRFKSKEKRVRSNDFNHHSPKSVSSQTSHLYAKVCVSQTLIPETLQTSKTITQNPTFKAQHYKGALNTFLLLFSFIFSLSSTLKAQQTYPVKTSIAVKYPSVFLDEFADVTNTSATVTLLDLQKSNYNVLVKLTMESPDLKLSSKEMIPLTISGGIPTDLDFSDPNIAKLFALSNLIPEKGKVDEFLTNKALPEGLYLLKLEVYDANFPTINVSNIHANITAVLVQRFDPPLLNLPQDNGSVNQDPFSMNLFFSWTPRSITANPAIQIYYQINMVEVPDGRNPYDAINIAGKTYPITMLADSGLTFPTFSFTPEQFQLQQGRTYAWQITAYEQDLSTGARRYQRFKNSGKSVVYTFTVQENCPQVNAASIITDVTGDKVNITWDKGYGHAEYELNYRELGSIYQYTPIRALVVDDNTDRQTVSIDISSLEKGIQYEFKIAAKCRSWQPDVYGGLFSVQKQDCSAPEPIKIESTPTEVVLTWDPTPNTQKYRLRYKGGNDALENEQSIEVTSPTASLPALQANKTYQIILDAVCVSGNLDLGRPYTIHEGENGYAGGCPIPQPFKLIVDHTPGVQQTLFKWSADASIHKSYKFYVVRKDYYDIAPTSVAWAQATTTVPQLSIDTLVEDRLYAYKVDYVCDNSQISTTAVGYFKLEKEPTVAVNPGTGDCFPPATKTAEGLTDKSASFEWSKSADAEEYQLFYAPQGSNIFKVFNTTRLTTSIDDLDVSQTHIYQYTIRARCPNAKYSIFTDTALVDLSQRYTGTCKYEGVFRSDRQAANEIRLVWKHTPSMAYVVTYRDEAQSISDPYTAQINADSIAKNSLLDGDSIRFTVTNLATKTNYVFHLQPVCGTEQGKKLGPLTVATLADANNGPCGQGKVICDSKSTVPLSQDSLIAMTKTKGDGVEYYEYDKASKKSMFSAADVEIIALDPLSYDATAKTFSGTGVAKLELDLGNVGAAVTGSSNVNLTDRLKTSVKFTNIKINDARCLIGGAVEITGLELNVLSDEQKAKANKYVDQYNAVLKQLIDAGKQLSEALELAKDYTEQAENYLDGGQAYGNVKTGSVIPVPPNADYSVTGNVVKDNAGNTIGTLANPVPTLTAKDTAICKKCGNYIEFENPIGAKYDFDEYKAEYFTHRKVAREYKALRINSSKYYYVSAKAMVEGKVDKVKIKSLSGYNASDLTFKSGAGLTYNFNASALTITLPGGAAGDGQDIYVYSKSKGDSVVGRLLVANYPTVTKKVVFVTVGDPTIWLSKPNFSVTNVKTEVEKLLNSSYNRIGINYEIELDDITLKTDKSWDADGNGMVQDTKSGFLDNDFTGEEKALTSLYYDQFKDLDTTKAYLFFTPDGKLTNSDLQGKMPRGRKGGFIFMNNSNLATVAKTVAHELAHGPHTLAHIFNSDWLNTDADQSNAANLMAYNSGVDLIKYQWDIMHDPGVVLGFFEKDKDAEAKVYKRDYKYLEAKGISVDFEGFYLSLSGQPIFLPKGHRVAATLTCGTLVAFELKNGTKYDLYNAVFTQGVFQGYSSGGTIYSTSKVFNETSDDIYVIRDFHENKAKPEKVLPVVAMFPHAKLKNLDPQNISSNNIISYKFLAGGNRVDNWEMIAVKNFDSKTPYLLENRYFLLKTNNRNTCLHNSGAEEAEYFLKGLFNDTLVIPYTFSRLDGKNNFNGLVTGSYAKFIRGNTTSVPTSTLYLSYNGKKYYTYQTIYLPEAKKNFSTSNYTFELGGMSATDSKWDLYLPNYRGETEFYSTKENINPLTYTKTIGRGRAEINVSSGSDVYSNYIIGSDIWLYYLSGIPDANNSYAEIDNVNGEYNVTIGAGDKLYFKYETSIPEGYPEEPKTETNVVIYNENSDGTLTTLSNTGFGTKGAYETLNGLGDIASSITQYATIVIKLLKKSNSEELAAKKIKVKIIPKETITKTTVSDLTNICAFDKYTTGRNAENGKRLYMIVSPYCDNSSLRQNYDKKLQFDVTTSGGNTSRLPVTWTFEQKYFTELPKFTTAINSSVSKNTGMQTKETFTTQLSNLMPSNNDLYTFNIYGFKIKTNGLLYSDVPNLELTAKAKIFNQEKLARVVFVHNIEKSIEFTFEQLEVTGQPKKYKDIEIIKSIPEKFKGIATRFKKIPGIFSDNDDFKFKIGAIKPSYKVALGEKDNSRLYEKKHEIQFKYGEASLTYTKKLDLLTYTPPPLKAVFMGLDWAGVKVFLGCKLAVEGSFGFSYKQLYAEEMGDTEDGPYAPVKDDVKFTPEIALGMSITPEASVSVSDKTIVASGKTEVKFSATMDYNPATVKLDYKIVMKPITFEPKIEVKNGSQVLFSESVIFNLTSKDWVLLSSDERDYSE